MRSGFFSFKKIKPSFIPPLILSVIVTILLTLPGAAFPKENWFDKLSVDKIIHICIFSTLVFLWCWSFCNKTQNLSQLKNVFIKIGLICIAYGVGMEFVQKYFIPNRSFELGDIIADSVGAAIGLFYSVRRYTKN